MKNTIVLLALPALSLAATCTRTFINFGNPPGGNAIRWDVEADGVPDRAGTCGGLWDNIHCTVAGTDCSGDNGHLSWSFSTSEFCNNGDVESAWWRATQNDYGSITCG